MEQIIKLKTELEQVQNELKEICNKSWKNRVYATEINQLGRRKRNIVIKINQIRQKYWYWD